MSLLSSSHFLAKVQCLGFGVACIIFDSRDIANDLVTYGFRALHTFLDQATPNLMTKHNKQSLGIVMCVNCMIIHATSDLQLIAC